MEATHIMSNPKSGKLGTLNEEEEKDDDDDDTNIYRYLKSVYTHQYILKS